MQEQLSRLSMESLVRTTENLIQYGDGPPVLPGFLQNTNTAVVNLMLSKLQENYAESVRRRVACCLSDHPALAGVIPSSLPGYMASGLQGLSGSQFAPGVYTPSWLTPNHLNKLKSHSYRGE